MFHGDKEAGRQFSLYIRELREQKDITMEQLCEGLCNARVMGYLEKGDREVHRLLQDCILERLGVGSEDFESYLGYEDYRQWKLRQQILHAITFEELDRAWELLEQYQESYCRKAGPEGTLAMEGKDRLERQFYLSMKGQLCRLGGSSRKELKPLYDEALELTVPGAERKSLRERVLSLKELNLILEAEQCREQPRPEKYQEVAEYVLSGRTDACGQAKIYPKAVYLFCCCILQKDRREEETVLLRYCNKALEILRDNGRMYYLWEILCIRERLLADLEVQVRQSQIRGRRGRLETIENLLQENRQWREVLEKVYDEFQVPRETFEYCYLYVIKGVNCVNDVIRIRRKMLDLSPVKLCEGICDVKTLSRLEKCRTVPQRAIVRDLFERLGLSRELILTDLVTASPEARKLMERFREYASDQQWENANRLLAQIKGLVSVEIKNNQQILIEEEIFSTWKYGKLDHKTCYRQMKKVLELTLPYEAFLKEGQKFLTINEQTCIQNMIQVMEKIEDKKTELMTGLNRFEEIYNPFIEEGLQEAVAGKYEFIMLLVGSVWGNMGEYDRADQCNENVIKGCLRFRRTAALHHGLYDRWWNNAERRKRGITIDKVIDDEEELKKCLLFSRLGYWQHSECFYQKKLQSLYSDQKGR